MKMSSPTVVQEENTMKTKVILIDNETLGTIERMTILGKQTVQYVAKK